MLHIINSGGQPNLIVFIHGFTGGLTTWFREDEANTILTYLTGDESIGKNYDIATFDYFTKVSDVLQKPLNAINSLLGTAGKGKFNINIESIGQLLKSELDNQLIHYERIVFIAHSMGGLVAKSFILDEIIENGMTSVKLFISLAVPHRGAEMATFGKLFLENPQIQNLTPLNQKLNGMHDQWIEYKDTLPRTVYVHAIYDNIIGPISAIAIDGRTKDDYEVVRTEDDHTSVVRPNANDTALMNAIRRNLTLLLSQDNDRKSNSQNYKSLLSNHPFANYITEIPQIGTLLGRDEELKVLKEQLFIHQRPVLLNGLGGIGKTSLARTFVNQNQHDFQHIVWINCINKNIRDAFIDTIYIDQQFDTLKNSKETIEKKFEAIISAFHRVDGAGLMVIDNVEQDVENIKKLLPQHPRWQIILTSRLSLSFKSIEIDRLSDENAAALFNDYYGKPVPDTESENLNILLREIDFHTLTIELIAKTMATSDSNLRFEEVIAKLQSRQLDDRRMKEIINVSHWDLKDATMYEHLLTTFAIANLTDYQIWVLQVFSVLPPQPISVNNLVNWLRMDDDMSFMKALKELKTKGWLKRVEDKEGNALYSIHRMVQDTVHYQCEIDFTAVSSLIETFTELLHINVKTDFTKFFYLLPYADALQNNLPVHFQDMKVGNFYNNLGTYYRRFGDARKAERLIIRSITIFQVHDSGPKASIAKSNLSLIYRDLGEYDKAVIVGEEALEQGKQHFEEMDPRLTQFKSNLAIVYQDSGELLMAKNLLQEALTADIAEYGQNHAGISRRLSNLAGIQEMLGEFGISRELMERALEIDMLHLDKDHPAIAIRQHNLAVIYHRLGDYIRARSHSETSIATAIRYYGKNHSMVAQRQMLLAQILGSNGDKEGAIQLLNQSLEIFKGNLPENHPHTINCQSLLDFYVDLL
ncbi:tetratricopeptide repeat protein [Dyadobacter subterraneus]|uniref:Tetratricopeptide repeat protein n=1 Tax=Dyadobacter subterraneus TaxID=2773304 RepID=A0ABR9W8Y5_9BACT|nr:tetratricopeptide repeat protein [Dyadobacter subterraneus]MBE9461897.1 tetratricopeptide repeat protein [Dyadobacter subterraneus]